MLFPAAGPRIIDWQTSQLASGAMDLQRLLLVSKLTTPQRRQLEPAAIAAYHRALCEERVDDHSLEQLGRVALGLQPRFQASLHVGPLLAQHRVVDAVAARAFQHGVVTAQDALAHGP